MRMKFALWLKRVIPPDFFTFLLRQLVKLLLRDARTALSEDLRKVGVTAVGIGLVGAVVDSVSITRADALIVLAAGAIIWALGLLLSTLKPRKE